MTDKMKLGLVVEGGGMKCVYGAGVLDRFLDEKIQFDYCIGVSAGAANTASFIAGQKERNFRFYTKYIADKRYLSVQNLIKDGQLFGLQYIYGALSNSYGKDPLDYNAIMKSSCEYEVVATNAYTGLPVYFGRDYMKQDDYSVIMASSAIPIACKPVRVAGELYYDGGISDSIPVDHALEKGCDKLVVILSKTRDYVKMPEKHKRVYTRRLAKYPNMIKAIDNRHIMYRNEFDRVFELEKEGKAFVFAPSKDIKISTYSKDADLENRFYELGLADFDERKEAFLSFVCG